MSPLGARLDQLVDTTAHGRRCRLRPIVVVVGLRLRHHVDVDDLAGDGSAVFAQARRTGVEGRSELDEGIPLNRHKVGVGIIEIGMLVCFYLDWRSKKIKF